MTHTYRAGADRAQVAVVTGATSGIGLATARRLAARGDAVFLVGRDADHTRAALERVRAGTRAHVRGFAADLASRQAVWTLIRELSGAIVDDGLALAAIVHSAGLYSSRRVVTDDRIDLTIAVNHLAPFLLTHGLLEVRAPASSTRIVVVSSNAHRSATLHPDRLARPKRYNGLRAYNQSKLANVLFVRELSRRLAGSGVRSYAVDPGLVDTGIGSKHGGPVSRHVWRMRRRRGTTPDVPARTIEALATGALGAAESGTYWRDGRRLEPSARALDDRLARALWRASCDLCDVPDLLHAPR